MSDQEKIIQNIKGVLEPNKLVYAFWVEGSTAQGHGDEYSDLDIRLEVEADKIEGVYNQIEKSLAKLGMIDLKYEFKTGNQQRKIVYHIEKMSEFLTIDINIQPYPWNTELTKGVDEAKIIFDKNGIVKFVERSDPKPKNIELAKEQSLSFYLAMRPNVLKNIHRNKPLEAQKYYRNIIEYVIKYLRIKYEMPEKIDFDFKHIYRDFPKDIVKKIDYFTFIMPSELESKLDDLGDWIKVL